MTQQKLTTSLSPKENTQTSNTSQQRSPHTSLAIRQQCNYMFLKLGEEFLASRVVESIRAGFGDGLGFLVGVGERAGGPQGLRYVEEVGGGCGEDGDAAGVGGADKVVFVSGEFVQFGQDVFGKEECVHGSQCPY